MSDLVEAADPEDYQSRMHAATLNALLDTPEMRDKLREHQYRLYMDFLLYGWRSELWALSQSHPSPHELR